MSETEVLERKCLQCGKAFVPKKHIAGQKQQRFCEDRCNDRWWNDQPEHPVIPKVRADHARALELKGQRTQLVLLEKADPYNYGYIPDHWEICNDVWKDTSELLISGGNRAGKTLWAARRVVETLISKDNVMCYVVILAMLLVLLCNSLLFIIIYLYI